jgi:hypothetical protein
MIEEAWEWICETLEDGWEWFTSLFENLNEFSSIGLLGATIFILIFYFCREWLLYFTVHMGLVGKTFWTAMNYLGSAVMGYLIFKKIFGDD